MFVDNVRLSRIDRLNCTFCRQEDQNVHFTPHAASRCTFSRTRHVEED